MSTVAPYELKTTLTQAYTVYNKTIIAAIRPHIYKANSPSGSLKLSIEKNSVEIASKTMTVAFIEANIENNNTYYHGIITFEFDSPVSLPIGEYEIIITGTLGYSYSSSTFIGWCIDFENFINNNTTTPAELSEYPLAFEPWSIR